jgi:site-specific DNA-methyltransferase (adenine-specific)
MLAHLSPHGVAPAFAEFQSALPLLDTQRGVINDPIRFAKRRRGNPAVSKSASATRPSNSQTPGSFGLPAPVFHDPKHHIKIYQGDCLEILAAIPAETIDLIFADPPYFLSNGGITCHAGRMVSVNKGDWDRSLGADKTHEFNCQWLSACQRVLKPNGTIWVSGTSHVIHSVGFAMQQLGFKLLNDISWVKPNPPPNLSCRYFTHSTETIIWAAKNKKSRHTFHYKLMKEIAGGRQMKSVWEIYPPGREEKRFGKHPTQKPIALLERILSASSNVGDLVFDPFMGSGTTAVIAFRLHRHILSIDAEECWVGVTLARICAELVCIRIAVRCFEIDLDLRDDFVDRSVSTGPGPMDTSGSGKLVRQERKYHFIGVEPREVIYAVNAASLEEAWERFRSSPSCGAGILFVVKTETEIYLAQEK